VLLIGQSLLQFVRQFRERPHESFAWKARWITGSEEIGARTQATQAARWV